MAIPAGQWPLGEGRLPDGSSAPFFIDRAELDTIREDGPAWKYHDARFLDEAVSDPDAIFEGLRRPNEERSLCYSVQPTRDPDDEETVYDTVSPPPVFGQVFLAFVRLGAMGYVVFDWEWRPVSPDEPGHPDQWPNDFARRVWFRP